MATQKKRRKVSANTAATVMGTSAQMPTATAMGTSAQIPTATVAPVAEIPQARAGATAQMPANSATATTTPVRGRTVRGANTQMPAQTAVPTITSGAAAPVSYGQQIDSRANSYTLEDGYYERRRENGNGLFTETNEEAVNRNRRNRRNRKVKRQGR